MTDLQKELLGKVFDNYAEELDANLYERAVHQKEFDEAWCEFNELKKQTYEAFNEG